MNEERNERIKEPREEVMNDGKNKQKTWQIAKKKTLKTFQPQNSKIDKGVLTEPNETLY